MRLAPRFREPLTGETMEELKAYVQLFEDEVARVVRVLHHFQHYDWRTGKRRPVAAQAHGAPYGTRTGRCSSVWSNIHE